VRGGDEEQADDEDLPNPGLAAVAPRQQVHVLQTAGGTPQTIGEGHSPAFSPAGDRLAFTNHREIWVWEAGGQARRLAKVAGTVSRLTWSPDGRRLLFAEARAENGYVGLLELAAARLTYLDPGLGQSVEPVFSPDGGQVAFIRFLAPPADAAPDSGPYWSIRVADVATGTGRQIWAAPAGPGGRYYGTRGRNLFWTRDGRLLFPWERTGWLHVHALDAARGGAPRPLTSGAFEVEKLPAGPRRPNADLCGRTRLDRRPGSLAAAA
jgi:Tol biopolymer transport system component